jgi:hypothetical protein
VTKQLLIYESVKPVSQRRHRDWSVKAGDNFEFARKINSVPVMAVEFPNICSEYTIVFTGSVENIMPVVIMGFRTEENLYMDAQGKWTARYIPAFLRRYPFIFSSSDNGKSFTLCLDEEFSGCNQQGRGERLFDAEGEQTQYLKNVLEFLKDYQVHYKRTERFSKKLLDLKLLEPMTAQFTAPDGTKGNLTGFMAVNREKLKSLDGEQLAQLAATDELELAYIHIQSLQNFNRVMEKLAAGGKAAQAKDAASAEETASAGGTGVKKDASRSPKKKVTGRKSGSK